MRCTRALPRRSVRTLAPLCAGPLASALRRGYEPSRRYGERKRALCAALTWRGAVGRGGACAGAGLAGQSMADAGSPPLVGPAESPVISSAPMAAQSASPPAAALAPAAASTQGAMPVAAHVSTSAMPSPVPASAALGPPMPAVTQQQHSIPASSSAAPPAPRTSPPAPVGASSALPSPSAPAAAQRAPSTMVLPPSDEPSVVSRCHLRVTLALASPLCCARPLSRPPPLAGTIGGGCATHAGRKCAAYCALDDPPVPQTCACVRQTLPPVPPRGSPVVMQRMSGRGRRWDASKCS